MPGFTPDRRPPPDEADMARRRAEREERVAIREGNVDYIIQQGYGPDEAEIQRVFNLKKKMFAWTGLGAAAAEIVQRLPKEWGERFVKHQQDTNGEVTLQPTDFELFHAISGSTLPKLAEGESYKGFDLPKGFEIANLEDEIQKGIDALPLVRAT